MEQLNSSTTSSEHHNSTNQIVFDQPFYDDITQARIQHLKLLNLSLKGKKLIDVGSGIGRFSDFFYDQGCEVFCIDGRPENIQTLRSLYPELRAEVVDVESQELLDYGNFDVVFCYGLLYHLSDPFGFIKNAYKICNEMMIIETCITDADDLILRLIPENQTDLSQALHAIGCRPSPSYIITCLKLCGFKYIYTPIELPNHVQFRYQRSNDFSYLKKGHLIRGIFVASHQEIVNEKLQQCS
jgi:2-polyprenyl-3-methyl-5-hydroxy-6-metoxy-1,4-benzoquinol methylase